MRLVDASYTLRLTFVTGAYNEVDNIRFQSTVPVEEHSWGMIKNMYKK